MMPILNPIHTHTHTHTHAQREREREILLYRQISAEKLTTQKV